MIADLIKYVLTTVGLLSAGYFILRILYARSYEKHGKLTHLMGFLGCLIFGLHGFSSYIFLDSDPSHINSQSHLFLIATVIMITGFVMTLLAMYGLGFLKMFGRKFDGIQQGGFYKYTRNPQILFYIMFAIGYSLLWPSWSGLWWILILVTLCHFMVLTEEQHLMKVYENDYIKYCYFTPRYLGIRKSPGIRYY